MVAPTYFTVIARALARGNPCACGDTFPCTGEALDADCHVVGAVPYKEMEKKCKKYCKTY